MNIKSLLPDANSKYQQGFYRPINPDKYLGDPRKIIVRSSYEFKFCIYCDKNNDVIEWASEPIGIEYYNKIEVKNFENPKKHKYFVDFYVKIRDKDGKEKKVLIEIKPESKLIKPVLSHNKRKLSYINEMKEYITNQSKFEAAQKFAKDNGFIFQVVTEKHLFKLNL